MMPDIYHWFGDDLQPGPTGDLLTVDGTELGQQRVIRRLLTAVHDYIFHLEYGAGVPQKIGELLVTDEIESVIRSQIFLEAAVAREPEPVITIEPILGGVFVRIQYVDAQTGQQTFVSFDSRQ